MAVDRKTGKTYNVSEEWEKIVNSEWFKEMMVRMKNEVGIGWPKREK